MALTKNHLRGGYLYVVLYGPNKKPKAWRVHVLVLTAFVGQRPDGMECCHADRDVTNNRLDNLRWGTHADNESDRVRHGTVLCGDKHPRARLTAKAVQEIREIYAAGGIRQKDLAHRFGVHVMTINNILTGKRWSSKHE